MDTEVEKGFRPIAALLLATFIWGATFALVKVALNDAEVLSFLALRFSLALLAAAVFRKNALAGASAADWVKGAIAGAVLYGAFFFQTLGLRFTSAANSAFITGLCVIMVPFLMWARGVRPRMVQLAGASVATMGLFWLSGANFSGTGRGDLLTIVCALLFAAHIICLGVYGRRMPPERLFALQMVVVAALAAASAVLWGGPVRPTLRVGVAVVVTGLLATGLAFYLQTWAQSRLRPTRAALWFLFEPVFALLFGIVLLSEIPPLLALLGGGLILAGVALSELGEGWRCACVPPGARPEPGSERESFAPLPPSRAARNIEHVET